MPCFLASVDRDLAPRVKAGFIHKLLVPVPQNHFSIMGVISHLFFSSVQYSFQPLCTQR